MKQSSDQSEILEEYNIWRKNVPYLYDFMFSHVLTWPSLSVQYFPECKRLSGIEKTYQRLLVSTNTNGEDQDFIHIVSVEFPDKYDEVISDEILGDTRLKFEQSIPVYNPVNIVRYNPIAFHLLAARFDTEDIYIYDCTNHLAKSARSDPDYLLKGHTDGGFGLSWNPMIVSELAAAGNDNMICIFDIEKNTKEINYKVKLKKHKNIVNELSYNYYNNSMLCSVSDDKSIIIWDTKSNNPELIVTDAHDAEIYSVHFSPLISYHLATASEDKSIKVWDTRNLAFPIHTLVNHSGGIGKVQWSPHLESILASAGKDKRVCLWDLSLSGNILSDEDAKDGPSELIFLHGGHTDNVFDIAWNPAELFEIASVSEDNILQIWQIPERE